LIKSIKIRTRDSLLSKIDLTLKDNEYFKNLQLLSTKPTTTEIQYSEYSEDQYQNADYTYDQTDYNEEQTNEQINEQQSEQSQEKNYEQDQILTKKENMKEIIIDEEEQEKKLRLADDVLRQQQVLLGVVGVDVPVLRLISKVSPKYQMGVGIYIIMLDNNGFIVFHPSIKKEITKDDFNFKGSSHSIDLDKFEIPIDNDEDFEELEHEMIDQITSNKTLDNWKREGLRVIRRRTEYVYTPVSKTPFSVAIASPNSFGRYYIDLPSEKESEYEKQLKELMKNKYESNIQLYNCSYTYTRLSEKILNPKQYTDYCIRYLFSDTDQVLAIKSDLVFHNIYYNLYNFSIFSENQNLVRSSFYGTYSGITFYLPVTFYRQKSSLTTKSATVSQNQKSQTATLQQSIDSNINKQSTKMFQEITNNDISEPPSEMTINVELGSISEPFYKKSTKPTLDSSYALYNLGDNFYNKTISFNSSFKLLNNDTDIYFQSLNLFSTESNKHTYSFEKQYYTRSIEFSDYLRTEFNLTEPVVNYFLNETSSKEARRDTVSATIPIWLDKVPTAVTGVVYDAKKLQELLFDNFMDPNCMNNSCRNLCSPKRGMNLTCYLVDEHGIVVLATERQQDKSRLSKEPIMGQPLYRVNPWLMKNLEYEGLYDLVIPGKKLPECMQLPRTFNGSNYIISFIYSILKIFTIVIKEIFVILKSFFLYFVIIFSQNKILDIFENEYSIKYSLAQSHGKTPSLTERIEAFNNEWRSKNSHCYYFGVYSFNLTRWKSLDSSELRIWCNSSNSIQRRYLAGYVKHSNLIILIVEDEYELIHCGNMSTLIDNLYGYNKFNLKNETHTSNSSNDYILYQSDLVSNNSLVNYQSILNENQDIFNSSLISNYSNSNFLNEKSLKNDFSINRYRKKPDQCFNYFENEKEYLPCLNNAFVYNSNMLFHFLAWFLFPYLINLYFV
jgi:hypothetical protein